MKVKQFRYSADNLGYVVYSSSEAVAIDGGAVNEILYFCRESGLKIKYIANTHMHHDHTSGNRELMNQSKAAFLECARINSDQHIDLHSEQLQVFPTPGHTSDSVCFKGDGFLITGDTLFNGTVGNCFSGDLDAFYYSLKRLISEPGDTIIYGGHDYVLESLQVARSIEKDNPHIARYHEKYDPSLIRSTLLDERKVNPYIRFNAQIIIDKLRNENMPADTALARFKSIMEIF